MVRLSAVSQGEPLRKRAAARRALRLELLETSTPRELLLGESVRRPDDCGTPSSPPNSRDLCAVALREQAAGKRGEQHEIGARNARGVDLPPGWSAEVWRLPISRGDVHAAGSWAARRRNRRLGVSTSSIRMSRPRTPPEAIMSECGTPMSGSRNTCVPDFHTRLPRALRAGKVLDVSPLDEPPGPTARARNGGAGEQQPLPLVTNAIMAGKPAGGNGPQTALLRALAGRFRVAPRSGRRSDACGRTRPPVRRAPQGRARDRGPEEDVRRRRRHLPFRRIVRGRQPRSRLCPAAGNEDFAMPASASSRCVDVHSTRPAATARPGRRETRTRERSRRCRGRAWYGRAGLRVHRGIMPRAEAPATVHRSSAACHRHPVRAALLIRVCVQSGRNGRARCRLP